VSSCSLQRNKMGNANCITIEKSEEPKKGAKRCSEAMDEQPAQPAQPEEKAKEDKEMERKLKLQKMRAAAKGVRRDVRQEQAEADALAEKEGTRVFGVPVATAAQRSLKDKYEEPKTVCPTPISICMEWIRQNGLDTEGLFRIPGSLVVVNQYKNRFNRGEHTMEIPKDEAVENVASIVIKFLNDLDPVDVKSKEFSDLYTKDYKGWRKLVNAAVKCKTKDARVQHTKEALHKLGPHSCEVFRQIIDVCKEATKPEHTVHNKMSSQKFGVCIFPSIMEFAEIVIEDYYDVFPIDFE